MPRVLIEGAAMGKPLLATEIRGSREVVVGGVTGVFVSPRDPAGLRRASHEGCVSSRPTPSAAPASARLRGWTRWSASI
jgi:hypothetical protein